MEQPIPSAARTPVRAGQFAPKKVVLHVGCGPHPSGELPQLFPPDQFHELRLDLDPTARPDIIGSMTDLSMFEDASVEGVFSMDSLEHLFFHDVRRALGEFMRVLAAPGLLVVCVPDLLKIAQEIVAGRLHQTAYQAPIGPVAPIDMLYGDRGAIAAGRPAMAHRTGFTPQSLHDILTEHGFAPVTIHGAPWHILAMAHKSEPRREII
jgi:hypothetical protein